eukprot:6212744-Pleurochrysis_carterae.AAC.2
MHTQKGRLYGDVRIGATRASSDVNGESLSESTDGASGCAQLALGRGGLLLRRRRHERRRRRRRPRSRRWLGTQVKGPARAW